MQEARPETQTASRATLPLVQKGVEVVVCMSVTLAFPTTHRRLQEAWTTSRNVLAALERTHGVYVNASSENYMNFRLRISKLTKRLGNAAATYVHVSQGRKQDMKAYQGRIQGGTGL